MLEAFADRDVFLPATFENVENKRTGRLQSTGKIENITQITYQMAGRKLVTPKKGVKGAHIFLTQRQVKNGHITNKPAFKSTAVNMEADTEIAKDADGKISQYIELNAVMVKMGRTVKARNLPRSWDQIFAQASACARSHLSNSAKGEANTGSKQAGGLQFN